MNHSGGSPSPMALLATGIPLSLLYDLVFGPGSADLLDHERPSAPSEITG